MPAEDLASNVSRSLSLVSKEHCTQSIRKGKVTGLQSDRGRGLIKAETLDDVCSPVLFGSSRVSNGISGITGQTTELHTFLEIRSIDFDRLPDTFLLTPMLPHHAAEGAWNP